MWGNVTKRTYLVDKVLFLTPSLKRALCKYVHACVEEEYAYLY